MHDGASLIMEIAGVAIGWHDVVGTIGVSMILLAYILLQTDRIEEEQLSFSLINAGGAALVLISLWVEFNFAAFLLEAVWLLVSFYGIAKWWRARRRLAP